MKLSPCYFSSRREEKERGDFYSGSAAANQIKFKILAYHFSFLLYVFFWIRIRSYFRDCVVPCADKSDGSFGSSFCSGKPRSPVYQPLTSFSLSQIKPQHNNGNNENFQINNTYNNNIIIIIILIVDIFSFLRS